MRTYEKWMLWTSFMRLSMLVYIALKVAKILEVIE